MSITDSRLDPKSEFGFITCFLSHGRERFRSSSHPHCFGQSQYLHHMAAPHGEILHLTPAERSTPSRFDLEPTATRNTPAWNLVPVTLSQLFADLRFSGDSKGDQRELLLRSPPRSYWIVSHRKSLTLHQQERPLKTPLFLSFRMKCCSTQSASRLTAMILFAATLFSVVQGSPRRAGLRTATGTLSGPCWPSRSYWDFRSSPQSLWETR